MNDFQRIWEAIPIRHDWASYFMVVGIGVGLIMIFTISSRWKSSTTPTKILSILLFCMCLTILDIFLGYTGLMKYILIANNFSETFVMLCIPLIYCLIRSIINKDNFIFRQNIVHFLIPVIYLIYQISQWLRPIEIKLNEYTKSHHPDLHISIENNSNISLHKPILYFLAVVYIIAIARLLYQKYKTSDLRLFLTNDKSKIRFVRNSLVLTLIFLIITIFTFNIYEQDLGDHIIGLALSYIIIAASYFLLNESRIFSPSWIADKYETSGFKTNDPLLLEKARTYITEHEYYLNSSASLKGLSTALSISPNLLSQKINSELQLNFNEYINQFRITESQKRLIDPAYEHLSIEGIGQSVGFKSKSSFYTAFKKINSMTPSVYKKQQNQS